MPAPSSLPNFCMLDFTPSPTSGTSAQFSNVFAPMYASIQLQKLSPMITAINNAKSTIDCATDTAVATEYLAASAGLIELPPVAAVGATISGAWIIKSIFDCGDTYVAISKGLDDAIASQQNRLSTGALFCPDISLTSIACMNTSANVSTGGNPAPAASGTTGQIPGGIWSSITPVNGSTVASGSVTLAANINIGSAPIDHVNFTAHWSSLGTSWATICTLTTPSGPNNLYSCPWNLSSLPASQVTISFDVYDTAGQKNLSPNGEWSFNYAPGSGTQCTPSSAQIALYTGTNFGGQCVVLGDGTYNDPGAMGLPNDSVQSGKVGLSAQLELCRDSGLTNTCQWFNSSNADLSTTSIGTMQASSAQVVSLAQYVTLCTGTNYSGTCQSFGPGGVNDLSAYGLSGNVQSIKVSPLVVAYVFSGTNQTGNPGVFNSNVPDLSQNSWANMMKSIRIDRTHSTACNNDPSQNGVLLYRNSNFDVGGGCVLLTSDNNDLGASLDFTGGSSLQFVGNYINHYQVIIYVDANYGTSCGSFFLNQSDLLSCSG